MTGAATPLHDVGRPEPLLRNALVRLLGWRGLLFQSDPPTWDRWRWIARQLAGRRPGRLLDAGSGSGGFVLAAATLGHRAIGLSFDDAANQMALRRAALLRRPNVEFRTVDLRRLDQHRAELGGFDLILCLETIEHLADDHALVRSLGELLLPGGALLVSTPFIGHSPLVGERLSATEDGGHVRWGYDAAALERLFGQAGLTLVSVEYLSGLVSQRITNLARRASAVVGERMAWALTVPFRVLLPFDRLLTRWVGHPWLAIAAVGRKP